MIYYIGCHIPRGADCEQGWKCRKGEYCSALEICRMTEESYKKGVRPYFGYYDSDDCRCFNDKEQAAAYLEKIKQDK